MRLPQLGNGAVRQFVSSYWWVFLGLVLFLAGMALALVFAPLGREAKAGVVREYTLEIKAKDIDYGGGAVWHAWTFSGTVPGPMLRVKVGETLRVRVINHLDRVVSFHAHLDNYPLEQDGSQANIITGHGADGMLPPGEERIWEYAPITPGLYLYHPHSSDKELAPSQVVGQGLYGAIVVEDPMEAPVRHEVLFMGEIGPRTEGKVVPFIMNGIGFPGGEAGLETVFQQGGYAALEAQFNKTLPVFNVRANEPFKLHVINVGNVDHSLYIHSAKVVSLGVLGGRPWPNKVIPLVPGAADTVLINFSHPGMWLFHCHVETHADAGMLGLFMAEEAGSSRN